MSSTVSGEVERSEIPPSCARAVTKPVDRHTLQPETEQLASGVGGAQLTRSRGEVERLEGAHFGDRRTSTECDVELADSERAALFGEVEIRGHVQLAHRREFGAKDVPAIHRGVEPPVHMYRRERGIGVETTLAGHREIRQRHAEAERCEVGVAHVRLPPPRQPRAARRQLRPQVQQVASVRDHGRGVGFAGGGPAGGQVCPQAGALRKARPAGGSIESKVKTAE
jgi:hypothetical protein